MRSVIVFTLVTAVCVAIGWWIVGLPGAVTLTVSETTFQAGVPVTLALLAALFIIFYILFRLLGAFVRAPRTMRRRQREKNRVRGDAAVNRTLTALAASDVTLALREAGRSRRLLGDTPLTLLLTAQAGRQAGREEDAGGVYKQLADRSDGRLLGLRGLLRQAMAREDWTEAAAIARRAEEVHPGTGWLTQERRYVAMQNQQWREALRLTGSPRQDKTDKRAVAALSLAASEQEADEGASAKLLKQAWETDPSLAPAAVGYAKHLRRRGRERAALDALRRTWAAQPQPDVAAAYLEPISDRVGRMRAAQDLAAANPTHPEAMLLLSRTALGAGFTAEARRHAESARKAGLNQRRLYVLMAEIAEQDDDAAASQEALRHMATAKADPAWRCTACGTTHEAWHPVCDVCNTPGRISWTDEAAHHPADRLASPTAAVEGFG